MDVCVRICKHYLSDDKVADVTFVDGQPVFPEVASGLDRQQTRRIIIYSEFTSMAPLFQSVRVHLIVWHIINSLF